MVAEAIDENRSFNVIEQRTVIKVDVFVPPPGPMGEGQLDRRRKAEFDEDLGYLESTARTAGLDGLLTRAIEVAKISGRPGS